MVSHGLLVTGKVISSPFENYFARRRTAQELAARCKELTLEKENALQENVALKASINFIQRSRDVHEFCDRYELKDAILGKVLLSHFGADEHYMLINRGSSDGVALNMIAAYKFQLVGKVVEVFPSYSKVQLITDKRTKVAAYTNVGNHRGIVNGEQNSTRCQLTYVNHLAKLEKDDLIISSGQGMIFPEGFCLGKIVDYTTHDLYHLVTVEPLVDLQTLEFCSLTNQDKIRAF